MKNITIILILLVVVVIGYMFFSRTSDNQDVVIEKTPLEENTSEIDFTGLSSDELETMLLEKDFTLIDVHTPEQVHVPGTDYMISYNRIDDIISVLPDKDERIVLYCRSGGMSKIVANDLVDMGYTNVFDLTNGMNEWLAEGKETTEKGSVESI